MHLSARVILDRPPKQVGGVVGYCKEGPQFDAEHLESGSTWRSDLVVQSAKLLQRDLF